MLFKSIVYFVLFFLVFRMIRRMLFKPEVNPNENTQRDRPKRDTQELDKPKFNIEAETIDFEVIDKNNEK